MTELLSHRVPKRCAGRGLALQTCLVCGHNHDVTCKRLNATRGFNLFDKLPSTFMTRWSGSLRVIHVAFTVVGCVKPGLGDIASHNIHMSNM